MSNTIPDRSGYHYFTDIITRWMDNDIYGHVNNVTYYSYFDTAANRYLIDAGGLDIHNDPVFGIVVESQCQYHAPVAFPEQLQAGLRVDRLGDRSVTYGIAIFSTDNAQAVAHGHFVHVFVDRETRNPVSIPEGIRTALEAIRIAG